MALSEEEIQALADGAIEIIRQDLHVRTSEEMKALYRENQETLNARLEVLEKRLPEPSGDPGPEPGPEPPPAKTGDPAGDPTVESPTDPPKKRRAWWGDQID